jgi:hypothetical protein
VFGLTERLNFVNSEQSLWPSEPPAPALQTLMAVRLKPVQARMNFIF